MPDLLLKGHFMRDARRRIDWRIWTFTVALGILSCGARMSWGAGVSTVIYNDPNTRVYYPRIMEFRYSEKDNGALLATCEEYKRPMPVHPIYKSTDKGKTWTKIGEVKDTQHGWGMRYQPMLFELPQDVGKLKKGTILCAGNSIPNDLSKTSIDVYRSEDGGATWTFMSTVCQGGRASPNGNEDPVWEPFLMLDKKGRLVCYESDERDQVHNQLLCHFVSEDGGQTWGPQVNDVALGRLRPGMVVIAPLPNGKYIMTYEMVGTPGNPITFKISEDGVDWGPAGNRGTQIITADDYRPGSTPYCVWAPSGGKNGMIIASGRAPQDPMGGDFVVNYNCGEGAWYRMRSPIKYDRDARGAGYSRAMAVASNGKEIYSVVELPNGQRSQLNMTFFRFPLEPAFGWSYELTAACSYKLLTANDSGITQQGNLEDGSQKWLLEDAGEGYCRLIGKGGKALEAESPSTAEGARVVLGDRAERDGQKWQVRYVGDGFFKLIAKSSGKCLTVAAAAKEDGAKLVQGPEDGGNAMKWRMDAVDCADAWGDWNWVPSVY
jgi:Ricin-type beta-trefoil lectin domain-like